MYGIAPEDRLRMAQRDQAERRQLAAADRLAKATTTVKVGGRTEAGRSARSLVRRPWVAAAHALHTLTHPHLTTHGTAH